MESIGLGHFDTAGTQSASGDDGVMDASDAVRWAVPGMPFERAADANSVLLSPMLEAMVLAAESAAQELAGWVKLGSDGADGHVLVEVEQRLRAVGERLDAIRLAVLPRIEKSDVWRLDQQIASGRFATWLARHDGITKGAANREVHTATLLADQLPETCDKALAGEVSAEQVRLMCTVAATSQARLAALHNPVINWEPINGSDADSSCPAPNDPATEPGNNNADAPTVSPPTGEQFLLELAGRHPLYLFGRMVRRFAHVSDPESDERGYKAALDREYFHISPTMDGYQLNGFLTEEHGLMVKTAVNSLMDKALNLSGDIVVARTARSTSQRCAQAVTDLAQLAMDTGMLGGGAIERRELVVHVSWTEFQKVLASTPSNSTVPTAAIGAVTPAAALAAANPTATFTPTATFDAATPTDSLDAATHAARLDAAVFADPSADFATYLDGNGYLAPSQLKRLACDSAVRRIVFGPDSQILDVGRSQRTVPAHVRTAVIARDKHCVYPGCDQPPQRCEVHHAINHWATGGETSAENSALLCWHHHAYVDQHSIKLRCDSTTKTWQFTTNIGQPITTKYELAS